MYCKKQYYFSLLFFYYLWTFYRQLEVVFRIEYYLYSKPLNHKYLCKKSCNLCFLLLAIIKHLTIFSQLSICECLSRYYSSSNQTNKLSFCTYFWKHFFCHQFIYLDMLDSGHCGHHFEIGNLLALSSQKFRTNHQSSIYDLLVHHLKLILNGTMSF